MHTAVRAFWGTCCFVIFLTGCDWPSGDLVGSRAPFCFATRAEWRKGTINELTYIEIICPGCTIRLELEGDRSDWDGQTLSCPECNTDIQFEPSPETEEQQTPQCPNCQAEMPSKAVLCVSCGFDLRTGEVMAATEQEKKGLRFKKEEKPTTECIRCKETLYESVVVCPVCGTNQTTGDEDRNRFLPPGLREARSVDEISRRGRDAGENTGTLMLLFPVISTFAIWFWIGQMAAVDRPGPKLSLISVATVIGTAILAWVEATNLGIGDASDLTAKGRRRSGPVSWFFFVLLLWFVGFPGYLMARAKYGLRNFLIPGILVALVFIGSMVLMQQVIDENSQEVGRGFRGIAEIANSPQCDINKLLIDSAKEQAAMALRKTDGDAVSAAEIAEYIQHGFHSLECPSGGEYEIRLIGSPPSCSIHDASLTGDLDVFALGGDDAIRKRAEELHYQMGRFVQGTSLSEEDCFYLVKASYEVLGEERASDFLTDFESYEHIHTREVGLMFRDGSARRDIHWELNPMFNHSKPSPDFVGRAIKVYNRMLKLGWEGDLVESRQVK